MDRLIKHNYSILFVCISIYLSIYLTLNCNNYSDKPNPKQYEVNEIYNFENWAALIVQFIEKEVQGRPCVLVCNSVGKWLDGWVDR